MSNLRKFVDNYDCSELEFPVSIKDIRKFEINNNIWINVLAIEGRDIYMHRKTNYRCDREIYLLLISEGPMGLASGDDVDYSLAVILNIMANNISVLTAYRVIHKN